MVAIAAFIFGEGHGNDLHRDGFSDRRLYVERLVSLEQNPVDQLVRSGDSGLQPVSVGHVLRNHRRTGLSRRPLERQRELDLDAILARIELRDETNHGPETSCEGHRGDVILVHRVEDELRHLIAALRS